MDAIDQLLLEAHERDRERQDSALLRLAMWLELNNRPVPTPSMPDFYEQHLSKEMLARTLTVKDQVRILDSLVDLFKSVQNPAVLWAIGKSRPQLGIVALVQIIEASGDRIHGDALYQMLISMEDLLVCNEARELDTTPAGAIKPFDLTRFVERAAKTSDRRVAEIAARVLERLRQDTKNG